MSNYEHRLTWDLETLTLGLGQCYVGNIDELLILNTAINAVAVTELHTLDGPVGEI